MAYCILYSAALEAFASRASRLTRLTSIQGATLWLKLFQNCDKLFFGKSMKMATFSAAWQLIQEWFVPYISTHLIQQIPRILRFFIRYNSYQCTCTILCLYFQFILCCVQNLIHCTLRDKVSGTEIFDSVLNIASNTAIAACDQLVGGI